MKKEDRIRAFVEKLDLSTGDASLHPAYLGYFHCFNEQKYYEAHDVLEQLWLKTSDNNYLFFKGLIQLAGAFVHLQKQFLRPSHPKDGRRLHPACRLFNLSLQNLRPYGSSHLRLNLEEIQLICTGYIEKIQLSDFSINPWNPMQPPRIELDIFKKFP